MDALTHDRAGGADVRQAARSVAVVAAVMTAVLLIKACQVVGFGALAYLTVRGAGSDTTDRFDGEVHA